MFKNLKIMIFSIALCACCAVAERPVQAETRAADLQKTVEDSLKKGQKIQSDADQWAAEQAVLLDRIRDLKARKRWLAHQKGKYETYMEKQRESLTQLKARQKETENIRMGLEPFLDETFAKLQTFVANDLPFLPEERQKRLHVLKQTLDNFQTGLDEKTRRVLEALQVEAGYGAGVEKTDTTLALEGGTMQAQLLRIGRTALFYRSPDGTQAGRFDRETGRWETLSAGDAREVGHAIDMAEKKRTPELLLLPLGTPSTEAAP